LDKKGEIKMFTVFCSWDNCDFIGVVEIEAESEEQAIDIVYGITGTFNLLDDDGNMFQGKMPLPTYCWCDSITSIL
jgi:hypothetical protein